MFGHVVGVRPFYCQKCNCAAGCVGGVQGMALCFWFIVLRETQKQYLEKEGTQAMHTNILYK